MVQGTDSVPKGHVRLETKFFISRRHLSRPLYSEVRASDALRSGAAPNGLRSDDGVACGCSSSAMEVEKNAKVLSTRFSLFLVSVRMAAPLKPRLPTRIPAWNRRHSFSDRPACVSRISTTHGERASSTARSNEDVEELLVDADLDFKPNIQVMGSLGKLVPLTSKSMGNARIRS